MDQTRIKERTSKAPVEELDAWSEHERRLLFAAHDQVILLNQLCLSPLSSDLPLCLNAVNPYEPYPHQESLEGYDELLFKKSDAVAIAKSFQEHPAFERALSNVVTVKESPFQANYEQIIHDLGTEIVEAGVGGNPEWLLGLERGRTSAAPRDKFLRHIAALLCLRESLANLDQLIYQALFQESLASLDRSNIIDYMRLQTKSGTGIWIMYLPVGDLFLMEPTDLVFVTTNRFGSENQLCHIHTQMLDLDFGQSIIEARIIDDNLNSFPRLIR